MCLEGGLFPVESANAPLDSRRSSRHDICTYIRWYSKPSDLPSNTSVGKCSSCGTHGRSHLRRKGSSDRCYRTSNALFQNLRVVVAVIHRQIQTAERNLQYLAVVKIVVKEAESDKDIIAWCLCHVNDSSGQSCEHDLGRIVLAGLSENQHHTAKKGSHHGIIGYIDERGVALGRGIPNIHEVPQA